MPENFRSIRYQVSINFHTDTEYCTSRGTSKPRNTVIYKLNHESIVIFGMKTSRVARYWKFQFSKNRYQSIGNPGIGIDILVLILPTTIIQQE